MNEKKIPWSDAEILARFLHAGQKYGDLDYVDGHVVPGVELLTRWGYGDDPELVAAMWLHDSIEDGTPELTGKIQLRQQIERHFTKRVGDIVWAMTGIGMNRKIRNSSWRNKIAAFPEAALPKLVDRYINYSNSAPGSNHRSMYDREWSDFELTVRPHVPAHLWEAFETLRK